MDNEWTVALEDAGAELSAFEKILENTWPKVISFGLKLIAAVVIFFVGKKLIAFLRKVVKRTLTHREVDTGVVQFLDALVKYVLYFMLFLVIIGQFGIEATSIFALAGSAGLTVGLALQGSLSNFAGGVLILTLKPFRVGDYIIEDTFKNEGTVKKIQLFYTTLETVDGKQITVPNATLANTSLTNATAGAKRMLALKVSVSYDADIQKAKETLLSVFTDDTRVDAEPAPFVIVSELADSCIVLELRGWLSPEDYWQVRWDALEAIITRFREEEIEIPYPQMDVHMQNEAGGVQEKR